MSSNIQINIQTNKENKENKENKDNNDQYKNSDNNDNNNNNQIIYKLDINIFDNNFC